MATPEMIWLPLRWIEATACSIDMPMETTMAARAEDDNAGGAAPIAPDQAAAPEGGTSGTNTQEAGVDEGDLVETDGRYVYTIVDGRTLTIVDTVEGTKTGTTRE